MEKKLRIALFGNVYQAKKSASIQKVLSFLSTQEAEVCIDRAFYEFLTQQQHLDVEAEVFDGNDFTADFVVSLGGDGTFLMAASRVTDKCIPILGVNMGRLGFLADVNASELERALGALFTGEYTIEERQVMEVRAEGGTLHGCQYALNDVAVLKHDNASMISIHTTVGGEFLTTFQADGLVLSTPTGSTAYSLSNGGPIIVPGTEVMSLTAVAPHSLNIRPIVIPATTDVNLSIDSRSGSYLVAIDGRSESFPDCVRLVIRRAPFNVRIVKRPGCHISGNHHLTGNYFQTLREKLMWGADTRQ